MAFTGQCHDAREGVESGSEELMQSQYTSHGSVLQITPKDQHVLQLLANGVTVNEVADFLGISPPEAEALLTRLFAAIGVATRCDAVASARRRGLLVSKSWGGGATTKTPAESHDARESVGYDV
jgi:DNA-binding CsgD family transcriptional regulator